MLLHFIISFLCALVFGAFEYLHNKATWSIKTTWFKYAAAIALGTFGAPYLLAWKFFQLAALAGCVALFLIFFSTIAKWLKVKVPGAPLKVVPLLFLVGMFASCQPDYHNKIEKVLQSSVYKQGVLDDATADSISKGWVDTVRIHTSETLAGTFATYNFTHNVALIKKTGYQNWMDFWHTAWRIIATILGAVFLFGGLYKFITVSNNNKNTQTKQEGTSTLIWLIPAFVGCVLLGCGIYPWSSEGYETKYQYDANQAKDGDQRAFDWNNIQGL
jgi:hypothetical protein